MNKQIYGALLLLYTVKLHAQWNQMGENINGIEGEKLALINQLLLMTKTKQQPVNQALTTNLVNIRGTQRY